MVFVCATFQIYHCQSDFYTTLQFNQFVVLVVVFNAVCLLTAINTIMVFIDIQWHSTIVGIIYLLLLFFFSAKVQYWIWPFERQEFQWRCRRLCNVFNYASCMMQRFCHELECQCLWTSSFLKGIFFLLETYSWMLLWTTCDVIPFRSSKPAISSAFWPDIINIASLPRSLGKFHMSTCTRKSIYIIELLTWPKNTVNKQEVRGPLRSTRLLIIKQTISI